jgi:hypothetical protein
MTKGHSHFATSIVFMLRRKLLEATLLLRLCIESRVSHQRHKGEEEEEVGGSQKRTLLLGMSLLC